jgi:hypothetical protein
MIEIQVPLPIILRDQRTGQAGDAVILREWAFLAWLNDVRWYDNGARHVIVAGEFDTHKKPGDKLRFEDADFKVLIECIKKPTYPQGFIRQSPLTEMQFESYRTLFLKAAENLDKPSVVK